MWAKRRISGALDSDGSLPCRTQSTREVLAPQRRARFGDVPVGNVSPRIRILLVEDNPEFLRYVLAVARREPMLDAIGTAQDGFQALKVRPGSTL